MITLRCPHQVLSLSLFLTLINFNYRPTVETQAINNAVPQNASSQINADVSQVLETTSKVCC